MKTLLATIVAALFITLFFVGGVYCLYTRSRFGFVYRRFRECLGGFVMVVIVYCFQ